MNDMRSPTVRLMEAAEYGQLETLKYLHYAGVDVTTTDNFAIRLAASKGHLDCVKFLISVGADIAVYGNWALVSAAYNGHLELVKYLISVGMADIEEVKDVLNLDNKIGKDELLIILDMMIVNNE